MITARLRPNHMRQNSSVLLSIGPLILLSQRHSVGVARQYCGQLGKQDNCQVAVTLSVANHAASLPVAYRLYLPENWAADPERRVKAGAGDGLSHEQTRDRA